jgi:hypothetical protein
VTVLTQAELNLLARKSLALAPQQLGLEVSTSMITLAAETNIQSHSLIGQERAKNALSFGLGVDFQGYNLYVMGEQASGRFTLVSE